MNNLMLHRALIYIVLLVAVISNPYPAHAAIRMAITMDDLPLRNQQGQGMLPDQVTQRILAIFKKHRVPEVYGFINAVHLESEPKTARQLQAWRAAGYPLGNHTYSHTAFDHVSLADFEKDIEKNEKALRRFSNGMDWKWLRFPYLAYGTAEQRTPLFSYLIKRRYQLAYTSLDFQDWRWIDPYLRCRQAGDEQAIGRIEALYMTNAIDALQRTEQITHTLFNRDVPYILLLHVSEFNVHMLDALLTAYEKQGVTFITLQEAQKDPVYKQFGLHADKIDHYFETSDVWQAWRGPLTLPGLTLNSYPHTPAPVLEAVCKDQRRSASTSRIE